MDHSDPKKEAPAALPEAHVANPDFRTRWRRPLYWLKRITSTLLISSAFIGLVAFLAVKIQACSAREAAECRAQDGQVITDVVRIKRLETGSRVLYVQPPGSTVVRMRSSDFCDAVFVTDAPAGKPMWAVRGTQMINEQCHCTLTYHVHAITDPNVE